MNHQQQPTGSPATITTSPALSTTSEPNTEEHDLTDLNSYSSEEGEASHHTDQRQHEQQLTLYSDLAPLSNTETSSAVVDTDKSRWIKKCIELLEFKYTATSCIEEMQATLMYREALRRVETDKMKFMKENYKLMEELAELKESRRDN